MLPFPQSPLSFRTVGLPQYGWKVGLSDSAFTHVALVKPTPGILSVTSALRLPFMHSVASPDVPLWVGTVCSVVHCHARSCLLYPSGPRSGLGYIVPAHHHLIGLMRPTHGHIAISPHCGL